MKNREKKKKIMGEIVETMIKSSQWGKGSSHIFNTFIQINTCKCISWWRLARVLNWGQWFQSAHWTLSFIRLLDKKMKIGKSLHSKYIIVFLIYTPNPLASALCSELYFYNLICMSVCVCDPYQDLTSTTDLNVWQTRCRRGCVTNSFVNN